MSSFAFDSLEERGGGDFTKAAATLTGLLGSSETIDGSLVNNGRSWDLEDAITHLIFLQPVTESSSMAVTFVAIK